MKTLKVLALIGLLAILAAIGKAVFFFGGYYNVAATHPDPAIVDLVLERVRDASVARHAGVTGSVTLDDPAIVQAGARAFADRGCPICHGAPGVTWQKFAEGLNPAPPDLAEAGKEHEPAQLFWVIKNGIKMTGMPSFGATGAEDKEIWSIVAFIKKLPNVSEADFKAWTARP
jgi:Cytochrome C oxidase, cbb3-type, subunit III